MVKSHRATKQNPKHVRALIVMFEDMLPEIARVNLVAAYSISVAVLALKEELSLLSAPMD
jgi:hypothetical protein